MILNELSIYSGAADPAVVNGVISELLRVCNRLFLEKGDNIFCFTDKLLTEELMDGYTIYDWLQNPEVPRKEKDFFRTMINRKQLIQEKDFLGSELKVALDDGRMVNALGCLAAYEWEKYVVSMNSSPLWQGTEICGIYNSLLSEESDRKVSVDNCCKEEHVTVLKEKQKNKAVRMVSTGRELWKKKEEIYPHLQFCDGVQKQLEEARISLHIEMIMKRLQILEDYFKEFEGQFDKNKLGYGCRKESDTVENNVELKTMRTFKTPYGKEEFFTWHISFAGNFPGRIHFLPDVEHRVGIVGYIGKHLPTGKYPTI